MEIFLIISIAVLIFVIFKIFSFNKDLKSCQSDILQTSVNLKALENKIENSYMPKAYPAQDLVNYREAQAKSSMFKNEENILKNVETKEEKVKEIKKISKKRLKK
jgi:hypothetical protein